MSNLSDIGFPVTSEQDVNQIIMDILSNLESVDAPPFGYYFKFEDPSGAMIFLQTNTKQEIVGFNPSFKGESRRTLRVTQKVERDTSEMDGAFECKSIVNEEETSTKILFDSPDFRVHEDKNNDAVIKVGITAFASNDFELFESEEAFFASNSESGVEIKSIIATGLFTIDDKGERVERVPPQAHAFISGQITEAYTRTNKFSGEEFYWLVVDTCDGFVDVVADPRLVSKAPQTGEVIKGSFWLSGRIE